MKNDFEYYKFEHPKEFKNPKEFNDAHNSLWVNYGEEKLMSNKFLPFINDDTNSESVFKALVQRSKGISNKDLLVIYSAILTFGVSKIKSFVETLNPTLSANDVFNAIASNYRDYETSVQDIQFWKYVILNYGQEKIKNNSNYSLEELSIMIVSLVQLKPENLKSVGFDQNIDLLSQYSSKDFNWNVSALSDIEFTIEGQHIGFTCFTEFKAFIAYYQENPNEVLTKMYPVQIKKEIEDVHSLDYSQNFCISPYKVYKVPNTPQIPEGVPDDEIPF